RSRFTLQSSASIILLLHCGSMDGPDNEPEADNDSIEADAQSVTADFFVATDGNDGWSGKLAAPNAGKTDGPLLTLDGPKGARAKVLSFKAAHPTQSKITVMVRAGTYPLSGTWAFTAADSGSASQTISYENYPGETPIVSGGVRLSG